MTAQDEYKVQLDVFEGPLDLLLYLIRKDEVDIYDIPIERITNQYMQYIDLMRMLDLNIAGEFIVMAATLMMIKSRMLLPEDERTEMEEEEEDPRWDLVRQLVEYKKFKDAAIHLQGLEMERENVFEREGGEVKLQPQADLALQDVSIFDLISAFNDALSRVAKEELREIFAERFTVGEKVDVIMEMIREKGQILLTDLFERSASRHEIVCTFLAMLELIRLRQIQVKQKQRFSEILIIGTGESPPETMPIAEEVSDE
ncbi:MAG: segregation/condensation protein A [Verrucomicrobia bacterium]|nr:segregation/condensation protein A [Verrucomicrobiota bacterium]